MAAAHRLNSNVAAVEGLNPRYGLLLPLNGGVGLRHDGLYVAVVEGLQHAATNVDVLLRHRPPVSRSVYPPPMVSVELSRRGPSEAITG